MTARLQWLRAILWLALLFVAPETFAAEATDPWPDDPDFVDSSPGLFFFALFALIITLIMIGVGLVLGVVACGLAAAFVGLGMVSASAVYGLLKRSTASGFRALFMLSGAVGGMAAGIGVAYIIAWIFTDPIHRIATPLIGGIAGLAAGLIVAGLFNFAWTRAIEFWKEKRAKKAAADAPRLRNT